jgi:hypothetical protein
MKKFKFDMKDLIPESKICEMFRLTKGAIRRMRESISRPEIVWSSDNKKICGQYGLTPGQRHYLPSEFQQLQDEGILDDFRSKKVGLGPQ